MCPRTAADTEGKRFLPTHGHHDCRQIESRRYLRIGALNILGHAVSALPKVNADQSLFEAHSPVVLGSPHNDHAAASAASCGAIFAAITTVTAAALSLILVVLGAGPASRAPGQSERHVGRVVDSAAAGVFPSALEYFSA